MKKQIYLLSATLVFFSTTLTPTAHAEINWKSYKSIYEDRKSLLILCDVWLDGNQTTRYYFDPLTIRKLKNGVYEVFMYQTTSIGITSVFVEQFDISERTVNIIRSYSYFDGKYEGMVDYEKNGKGGSFSTSDSEESKYGNVLRYIKTRH